MPHSRSASASTRRANLARLLRIIHEQGEQSRAELTAATGLNRSTIADLVADLTAAGLVDERMPTASRRVGRPSPVVSASGRTVAIAVNPEVDVLEIAAVGLDRSIIARDRIENRALPTPEDTARVIAATIEQWRSGPLADHRIEAVGVAVPGLVRASDGLVRNAPHLVWRDAPLADLVAEKAGLRTVVDNDAALGARAEHLFGAARGLADVVYLNGGASGIGGALIVHGMLVGGAAGYAGEFGQNRPALDTAAPGATVETLVSRRVLLQAAGQDQATDAELADLLAAQTPSGSTLAEEASRQRSILAGVLANAANVLNPSVIVLGGFLAVLAEAAPDALRSQVTDLAMPESAEDLSIRPAELGADRLLIGAADAAFAALIDDPLASAQVAEIVASAAP